MKRGNNSKKQSNSILNNVALLTQLVEIDLQQKRFDAARQRIRSQFQGGPDSAGVDFLEARVLAAEGKWDGVEDEVRQTLRLVPIFRAPMTSWDTSLH